MTHRDELLALKARIDALEQDNDEARSEIELLRAAHAQKTREAETLRRRFDALAAGARGGPAEPAEAPPPVRITPQADLGRSLRFAAIAASLALLGMMGLSATMSAQARHRGLASAAGPVSVGHVTPLLRVGAVVETSGPELVSVGEQCTVERIPVADGFFDCRIEVRCGEQTLYGADPRTGYVRCAGQELVRDPDTTTFDGDPAMTFDLAHGVVTVEERVGLGTQRVRIQL